jgi:hypothetical protein
VKRRGPSESEEFKPLISFHDDLETGRKLYEDSNKNVIQALARNGPSNVHVANYQTALNQLWNSLTDEERAEWNRKGAALTNEDSYESEHIFE